jgi:integrase
MVGAEVTPGIEAEGPRRRRRLTFTAPSIDAYRPGKEVEEFADPKARGLVLRIHPSGVKSFRWRIRTPGLKRVVTIGPWAFHETPAHVTLAQARTWLERLQAARRAGEAELARVEAQLKEELAPRAAVPDVVGCTVEEVAKRFLALLDTKRKRPEEARYVVEKDILPIIGHLGLRGLKKSDCRVVVERVVKRGAPVHAGKVLGLLKQLLSFASNVEDEFINPIADLKAENLGVENNIRDRWLTEKELPVLLQALEMSEAPRDVRLPELRTRVALRLLLLTAVRSAELRLARWEEVDLEGGLWTVPVTNQKLTLKQAKQAKPFVIPLSPTALELFGALRAMVEAETREGEKPSPWVLASGRADEGCYTDKALGKAMRRFWRSHPELKMLPEASPHDLRRTARTWLGRLGVAPHIAERCLNHSVGRIAKIYDQGDYLEERRAALEKWDAFLLRLVQPEATNVIPMQAAR